jgi:molybdopterin molybdotransferase
VAVLTFQNARQTVVERIHAALQERLSSKSHLRVPERVRLLDSAGRVLAEPVRADRDFPPFPRSTRDGFAVRSTDVADAAKAPAELRVIGQLKAGSEFAGSIGPRECIEIMTGAPVPQGADAVVMVEYTSPVAADVVRVERAVAARENVVARGSEARQGDELIASGRRIRYGEIAMMASIGQASVAVFPKPRVAIIPTGDEVVEVEETPGPVQIRNSNGYALAAQVAEASCEPVMIGIAPDREDRLREMIAEGLRSDLLILSGGVSRGKFDLVEQVLAELGAEFYYDGVLIQPGRPLVFGRAGGTFFFGLPGNPLSTMVTFELFVRPALALLSGEPDAAAVFLRARLSKAIRRKPGLTAFLPAVMQPEGLDATVATVDWKGSGDVASLNRANCFIVIPEDASELHPGEWVGVLPR